MIFTPLATINANNPTFTYTSDFVLGVSGAVGLSVDNNGFYGNDSTGFNFSVTAVPEPAALLLSVGSSTFLARYCRVRRTAARRASTSPAR